MTAAKVLIDSEGRLQTDAQTLERLKNLEFEVQVRGQTVRLESRPPLLLHEIEDAAERMQVFDDIIKRIAHPGPHHLPEDWDSRDSIYD